ncbi:MAG: transporter [Vicinamibacterales bacterium]
MRRTLLALLLCLPATAFAQETGQPPVVPDRSPAALAAATAAMPSSPAPARFQQPEPPPPPPPPQNRRRPSMVGYIGDATIGSQFRVRFDAAFENTAPDRAEFFYGKCGCYRGLPTSHPAYDPDAPGPGPGIASSIDYRQLILQGEYAAGDRVSVYGELPFRWVSPQSFVAGTGTFDSSAGVGDLRVGGKFALVAMPDRYVTVQLQLDAPTGDAGQGLGTDHWSVSPMLLYFQRLTDRVTFESQFGSIHPVGGSAGIPTDGSDKFAGTVVTYGAGASVDLMPGASVGIVPVLEFVGWHVVNGFQTSTLGPADGTDIFNVKIGARIVSGPRGSACDTSP